VGTTELGTQIPMNDIMVSIYKIRFDDVNKDKTKQQPQLGLISDDALDGKIFVKEKLQSQEKHLVKSESGKLIRITMRNSFTIS